MEVGHSGDPGIHAAMAVEKARSTVLEAVVNLKKVLKGSIVRVLIILTL